MRLFAAIFLLLIAPGVLAQAVCRDVVVSWAPPDQSNIAPATIDGYRILYSFDGGPETVIQIDGYDTSAHTLVDAPCGNISVYMLSYCPQCDIQLSGPSNTVTKLIEAIIQPEPPTVIDLTPLLSALEPGKYPFRAVIAGVTYTGDCRLKFGPKFRFRCRGIQ